MKMDVGTALISTAVMSAAMAVLSFIIFLMTFSYASQDDTLSYVYLVAAIIFGASAFVVISARSKYAGLSEEDRNITCFRLKKAGIVSKSDDGIIPKGKMPKE